MPIAPKSLNLIAETDYSGTDFSYVDGLIGPGQFTYLTGHPGSGKSFALYELGLCLISGRPFLGRAVNRQANCLLVDGEMGEARCGRRLQRMMRGESSYFKSDFYLDTQGRFRLDDEVERKAIIAWMIENDTDVLLIDSLTRIVGSHLLENESKHMALVGQYFTEIKDRTDCSIMVIHHSSKGSSALRGSSELLAQADNVFLVEERSNVRVISPVKTRDLSTEEGFRAAFTITAEKNDGIALTTVLIPQKSEAYGNDLRERINDTIRSEQGISSRDLREKVKCANATLLAILKELSAENEIELRIEGHKKLYYRGS